MPASVWFLVYERPGAPALTVQLRFSPQSVCLARGAVSSCELLQRGERARAVGLTSDSVVSVDRIEILE
jgi:hypothetical protein